MSEHKFIWGALAIASLATALITWRFASRSDVAPRSPDPATTAVEMKTIDLAARMVADALRGSDWQATCEQAANLIACAEQARERKANGFPALPPGPVPVGAVTDAVRSLERMRLQPVRPRGHDNRGGDALLVRVSDGQQWLDYMGHDPAGREFGVSIALALEGGTPTKAVLRLGEERRELALAGRPKTANGNAPLFLLPEAGGDDWRYADFYSHPNLDWEGTLMQLRNAVPRADPAFRAPMVRQLLAAIAGPLDVEDSLGLQPALIVIEQRADLLRAAGASDWLPVEDRWRFVSQWFPDQPVIRAAWAHAVCDPDPDEPGTGGDCWKSALSQDGEIGHLLRAEVSRQESALSSLAPQHPLRLRLRRWRRLWGEA